MTRRDFLLLTCTATFLPWKTGSIAQKTPEQERLSGALAQARTGTTFGEKTGLAGLYFLNTPYVGSTLDLSDNSETCIVNLSGLDCVTFYETSLAISRMATLGLTSLQDLKAQLTLLRYRGGNIDGYLSRLHYTSDWIHDNSVRGNVKDLTPNMPAAVKLGKRVNFMSTHPELYRQLKANPDWVIDLIEIEKKINPNFVPRDRVFEAERALQTGDIVGITSSKDGLDCSHTGLVYRDEDGPRLLHASSTLKKVVLGPTVAEYIKQNTSATGIMACRPLEPTVR